MIKRTIEISRDPVYLSVRLDQLVLRRDREQVGSVPCEDVGVVMVDHPQTTYSHAALTRLAESGATVVLCGRDHQPTAMLLPLSRHGLVVQRIQEQLAASLPLQKRLWRQIVRAKIRAQAENLPDCEPARAKLLALSAKVKSGDSSNVEAWAAKAYWGRWIAEEEFRRDPDLPGTNAFLNYGYAVLRAAVARAIVAAGLLASVGIHHRNRSNPFCLADDLMEPLRPLVDARVRQLRQGGYEDLDQEAKSQLLEVLSDRVGLDEESGPLLVNLHRMAASLVRCYQGLSDRLSIPTALHELEEETPRDSFADE